MVTLEGENAPVVACNNNKPKLVPPSGVLSKATVFG